MLDSIINLVKSEVSDIITNKTDIPEDKKSDVVSTTTESLLHGLKSIMTPDNLTGITSLFGGGDMMNHNLTNDLQSSVTSSLTQKTGLSSSTASSIAAIVIPAILSLFKNKIDDDNEPGFNLDSLLKSFTSGNSSGGGLLGMLGKLFGK